MVVFFKNGWFLVIGGMDGKVKCINFKGEFSWEWDIGGIIEGVVISSDG